MIDILKEKFEKYYDFLNKKMIEEQIIKRGIKNEKLIDTLYKIKRHFFIPDSFKTRAYDDCAIEIEPEQTISQPYITALLVELLELQGSEKVLEIGTGTGWQTAILSQLSKEVFSIDIRDNLYEFSRKNLEKLNISNVKLKIADGKEGWQEEAPFERIVINCYTEKIPEKLFQQLADNGILVAPIGNEFSQILKVYKKSKEKITQKDSIPVRFVKML